MQRHCSSALASAGLLGWRVVTATVVGRDREIGVVDDLLERVRDGGAALVIRGDPGIGKSALLAVAKELTPDGPVRL